VNQAKSNLRQQLRSLRNGLTGAQRKAHDEAIGRHLLELVSTHHAGLIAGYWPFNGEPDIIPSCRHLMTQGCGLALPVIKGENAHLMDFHEWREDTVLAANRYGILEPLDTGLLPVSSFDMLLMPLVGYDRSGNRLGMGAGYYDRCLVSIRDLETPLRVGVAYSVQEMEPVEEAEWDIPLHGVLNERGWFVFDGRLP